MAMYCWTDNAKKNVTMKCYTLSRYRPFKFFLNIKVFQLGRIANLQIKKKSSPRLQRYTIGSNISLSFCEKAFVHANAIQVNESSLTLEWCIGFCSIPP
jgi:hypothetical protein